MINSVKEKAKKFIYQRPSTHRLSYHLELGGLALAIYLGIAWFILIPPAFWSPDEGAKLLQIQNLRLENGRPAYDIDYTGRQLDPDLQFATGGILQIADNRLYLQRFPLFPLFSLPFFHWFGFYGLYVIPAIGGAAIGLITLQLLQPQDRRLSMWILTAFASPVVIYATIFWEHTLVTSLCLGAAWLSFQLGSTGSRQVLGWMAIGLILALSVYMRTETVFFALAWLASYGWLTRKGRRGVVWAGGVLGFMLLLYVPLHRAMFGQTENILHNSFLFGFRPLNYLARAGWQVIPDFLIGPPEDEAIASGWLGWVWAIAAVTAMSCSLINSRLARHLMWIGLGLTAVVAATFLFNSTMYRSAHGLLFTTPWAALGLCRAREIWQRGDGRMRVIVLATLLGLISYLLALSVFRAPIFGPQGALEWGARYVMTFYPFLALVAAWDLKTKRLNISSLIIIAALLFLGIGFQIRGLWTIRHDKQINAALNQVISEAPHQYILSDLWWLPLNAAPLYPQKTVFFAMPDKLTSWIDLAAAHQIHEFLLVTLNPSLLEEVNQSSGMSQLRPLGLYQLDNLLIFHVGIEAK